MPSSHRLPGYGNWPHGQNAHAAALVQTAFSHCPDGWRLPQNGHLLVRSPLDILVSRPAWGAHDSRQACSARPFRVIVSRHCPPRPFPLHYRLSFASILRGPVAAAPDEPGVPLRVTRRPAGEITTAQPDPRGIGHVRLCAGNGAFGRFEPPGGGFFPRRSPCSRVPEIRRGGRWKRPLAC